MKNLKVVILCGGEGTRIRDVSEILPKPMLPIGGKPILWHIMKIYAHYGIKDFILCLGYKGWVIKEFFLNYHAKTADISLNLGDQKSIKYHNSNSDEDWNVTLVETGEAAQTGARIWNAKKYLRDCDVFAMTYGDGVADIDIPKLIETYNKSGLLMTVTGVHPVGRFGEIELKDDRIREFNEKPNVAAGLINGGFMLINQKVLGKYFKAGEDLNLERDVIPPAVKDGQVGVFRHEGFWECMDTAREYKILNQLWEDNKAPWKVWK